MVGNGPDHARARVPKHPILPAPVQQYAVVRQNNERLGAVPAQGLDVVGRGGDGESHGRVGAVLRRQAMAHVKRPLQALDGVAVRRAGGCAHVVVGTTEPRSSSSSYSSLSLPLGCGPLEAKDVAERRALAPPTAPAPVNGHVNVENLQHGAELRRLPQKLVQGLPRGGADAPVQVEAVHDAVDKGAEAHARGAQDAQRLGEVLQAEDAGEEEPRAGAVRVVVVVVDGVGATGSGSGSAAAGGEALEGGDGADLAARGVVAQALRRHVREDRGGGRGDKRRG